MHLRLLGETAGKILGQQVIVDVKPGAAGTLAPAMLLNAKPDGHAIACMSINSLRYPHYQQTSWNPLRDFTCIIGLSGHTLGIVVRSDAPWKSLEELLEAGRKEPEKYKSPYGLVGPKDLPPATVEAIHLAFKEAMADPRVKELLDKYIQAEWYKSPAEYRGFAEKYFVDVKPLLVKAGLAQS
ncbi:MAG: hypothetical protein HYX53_03185 [Chloroflexi bacterium]|nr:hypothetical protein [Chloroflexota bacterium]